MSEIIQFLGLREHLAEDPIPLGPFLKSRVFRTNDKVLSSRLDMIDDGLVPNYPEWCEKLGTIPPYVLDKPDVNGRSLFRDDEGPKASPSFSDDQGGHNGSSPIVA